MFLFNLKWKVAVYSRTFAFDVYNKQLHHLTNCSRGDCDCPRNSYLSSHYPLYSKSGYHRSESGYHRSESGYHRSESGYHRSESGYHSSESGYHRTKSGHHRTKSGHHRTKSGYHRSESVYYRCYRPKPGYHSVHFSECMCAERQHMMLCPPRRLKAAAVQAPPPPVPRPVRGRGCLRVPSCW